MSGAETKDLISVGMKISKAELLKTGWTAQPLWGNWIPFIKGTTAILWNPNSEIVTKVLKDYY